ncbi:MAG: 30S ribosomal protein S5 [Armatimonadetes bacterium]|nr:MAG: 30S ribosomal protein S5 [Armatimonadota bacterium]
MKPENINQIQPEFFEKVVHVNRVSKKTKGGDKRSLSVLVVAGDKKGRVGVGLGKASDVQSAVRKATTYAKKHLISISLIDNRTIPHSITIKRGAARVLLRPAPAGTGIIAGGAVRVVVEAAGISDVVSKILGTNNRASNVYATLEALGKLKTVKVKEVVKGGREEDDTEEIKKETEKPKKLKTREAKAK